VALPLMLKDALTLNVYVEPLPVNGKEAVWTAAIALTTPLFTVLLQLVPRYPVEEVEQPPVHCSSKACFVSRQMYLVVTLLTPLTYTI
jgi:hypothetical protein